MNLNHAIAACLMALTGAASLSYSATPAWQDEPGAETKAIAIPERAQEDPVGWLLEIAADAAAIMPLEPHIKTRSRLQATVVEAALVAGRESFAAEQVSSIANWRRGLAQAAIAVHFAELGAREEAESALAKAQAIEQGITAEFDQGWRRDRVRVTIARAFALLGDRRTAAAIQMKAEPSEAGRLAVLSVGTIPEEQLDKQIGTLREIASNGGMEQVKYALLSMAELYGRFYESKARRDSLTGLIRDGWKAMPLEPRIEVLEALLGHDVAQGHLDHARKLADEITTMVTGSRWNLEQSVAMHGRAADAFALIGQPEKARALLADAVGLYAEVQPRIVSVYRGRALRPLAESYAKLGDGASACEVYVRALEEALVNPNSRPRAEDLVATCASIVESGLQPSTSLIRSVAKVRAQLGTPW